MKFLPKKYRESRTDWFAKRCQVVYCRVNGLLEWQGFIHVIQTHSQGSRKIVTIMQDVLRTLKLNNFKFNPESITAWRAYGIGSRKDIRLEKQSSGKC